MIAVMSKLKAYHQSTAEAQNFQTTNEFKMLQSLGESKPELFESYEEKHIIKKLGNIANYHTSMFQQALNEA